MRSLLIKYFLILISLQLITIFLTFSLTRNVIVIAIVGIFLAFVLPILLALFFQRKLIKDN